MQRIVKKLYRGCVELRDYDVQDCFDRKEKMKVIYEGDMMTLSPADLMNKLVGRSTNTFPSKIGGKSYKLCSYYWEPDPVEL